MTEVRIPFTVRRAHDHYSVKAVGSAFRFRVERDPATKLPSRRTMDRVSEDTHAVAAVGHIMTTGQDGAVLLAEPEVVAIVREEDLL
jgi:hypothetical protein